MIFGLVILIVMVVIVYHQLKLNEDKIINETIYILEEMIAPNGILDEIMFRRLMNNPRLRQEIRTEIMNDLIQNGVIDNDRI